MVKTALHVTSSLFDELVTLQIDAAKEDLLRCGVESSILEDGSETALVKQAIIVYAQGHFGLEIDTGQASRLEDSYKRVVLDLLSHVETGYLVAKEAEDE